MSTEVIIALIGGGFGLAGAVIGAVGGWWAASSTNALQKQLAEDNKEFQKQLAAEAARAQRWATVEAMALKLSEFAMQYPKLEQDDFCEKYPCDGADVEDLERYQNYCCYVFNAIGAAWDFAGGDAAATRKIIQVEELIRRHYRCWEADKDNLGHDQPFRAYVQSIIDDLKRKGDIK